MLASLVEAMPPTPFTIRFEFRTATPRIRVLINDVEKLTSDDTDLTGPGRVLVSITQGAVSNVEYESVEAANVGAGLRIPIAAEYQPALSVVGEYDG